MSKQNDLAARIKDAIVILEDVVMCCLPEEDTTSSLEPDELPVLWSCWLYRGKEFVVIGYDLSSLNPILIYEDERVKDIADLDGATYIGIARPGCNYEGLPLAGGVWLLQYTPNDTVQVTVTEVKRCLSLPNQDEVYYTPGGCDWLSCFYNKGKFLYMSQLLHAEGELPDNG